jgi:hypothetical protein
MQILLPIQRFMATSLSAGIFMHDVHYTTRFFGINLASIVFLTALFWFHVLVLLKETGFAEVKNLKDESKVEYVRHAIALLTIIASLVESLQNRNSYSNYLSDQLSMDITVVLMIVFPEIIFKFIFLFKQKRLEAMDGISKTPPPLLPHQIAAPVLHPPSM